MRFKTLVAISLIPAAALVASNWTTAGHDPQRTGWSPQETDINKGNIKSMGLLWKTHLDNEPRELNSLSQVVVVEWVPTDKGMREYAIVAGSSDHLFALDPDNGKIVWQKTFANAEKAKQKPFWLCPAALNATPLIRKQGLTASVYTISSDGKLHILNVIDGEDRVPPMQFVPAFSKNWSLNLDGDTLYTNTSQGCGGAKSGVWAMDLKSPDHKVSFFASTGGVWGRSGIALSSTGTIFAGTGDGQYDAAAGKYPDTILQLSPKEAQLVDYFTPTNHNYLTRKDLDMGSMSPLVFTFHDKEIVAAGGKEGVVYLLDAKGIGGGDHKTPLYHGPVLVNEEADFAGKGFWGAFATAEDENKNRWLFAPALGAAASGVKWPNTNGDAPNGSIMALRIEDKDGKPAATPAWISRDMNLPEPPIVAGGLVFAISNGEFARQSKGDGALFTSAERIARHAGNTVLYAFDMTTGKQLFSSGDTMPSWTHFSGISISGGRVYVTTFDSTVYAFGIKE